MPESGPIKKVLEMNKTKNKEDGFTLVEVLVAISILAFGLLAVASMQLAAIQANSFAIETTEALNVAQDKMEELIALPFNDAALLDQNGDAGGGLGNPTKDQVKAGGDVLLPAGGADQPDYGDTINIGGRNYYRYWNVDANTITNTRIIKVIVAWNEWGMRSYKERGMRRAYLDYIKHP
jgi:type IV pilus assembly protein PilV